MALLYLMLGGLGLYTIGVVVGVVVNGNLLNQSLFEIVIGGVLFTAIYAIGAGGFVLLISTYAQSYLFVAIVLPLLFFVIKSYDYLLLPLLMRFFRKNAITHQYDHILKESSITAKILLVEGMDNAFAMGLIPRSHTILLGSKLKDQLSEQETIGVLYHEIAHCKQNHLYILLLIDFIAMYLMFAVIYIAIHFYPDSYLSVGIGGGIAGGLLPFIGMPMKYLELKADVFAARHIGKAEYIESLNRLNDLSNGRMDKFSLTHPRLKHRIQKIEKYVLQ